MAKAVVNGTELNYRQAGTGPDLVLLHGLGANQAFWNIALVGQLACNYHVTVCDLRGHGYSATPATGYHYADLAADLHGLLDHLGIEQAHLLGHSLGGVVALRFALDQPERTRSLILVDSRLRVLQPRSPLTEHPAWPAIRDELAREGVVLAEEEPEIAVHLFEILAQPGADRARQLFTETMGMLPFGAPGSRSARHWLQLVAGTSIKADFCRGADVTLAELAQLRCPVLALYGERSPNCTSGEGFAACLPRCRLVFVPGANHFLPLTHPHSFLSAVETFLAEHPPSAC